MNAVDDYRIRASRQSGEFRFVPIALCDATLSVLQICDRARRRYFRFRLRLRLFRKCFAIHRDWRMVNVIRAPLSAGS